MVTFPPTTHAEISATKVARWYKIYWNSAYIADLKVGLDGDKLESLIDTRGIVKRISKYSNHTYSTFHVYNGLYMPDNFRSNLRQRHGNKDILIEYAQNGKIIKEEVIPPDNRAKRKAVSEDKKNGAVDPLTAAVVARQKIKYAIAANEKEFSFDIYDGRRLSRLNFHIYGKENIKLLEKNMNVLKIGFKRLPIEGFTKNEFKRMKGEEPDFIVYLEEGSLLPVKSDAAAPLGKALFVLEKECETIASCG